jgi:hypothetical protein
MILQDLLYDVKLGFIERGRLAVSTPVSYLEDPWFKSQYGDWHFLLSSVLIFLSPSTQMPG